MGVEVQRVVPDDALALTRVGHAAFESDVETRKSILYDGASPAQREEYWTWRSARMRGRIEQKGVHAFKAVDTETGEIVGFSLIVEPRDQKTQAGNQKREADMRTPEIVVTSKLAATEEMLAEARKRCMGDRWDFWYIMSMAVHPGHQRRGVGQALLQADLALPDEAKMDTYLESRPAAVKLYLSQGFEQIGQLRRVDDGEVHPVMLRKAKA